MSLIFPSPVIPNLCFKSLPCTFISHYHFAKVPTAPRFQIFSFPFSTLTTTQCHLLGMHMIFNSMCVILQCGDILFCYFTEINYNLNQYVWETQEVTCNISTYFLQLKFAFCKYHRKKDQRRSHTKDNKMFFWHILKAWLNLFRSRPICECGC